jgi:hypothetical protein
MAKSKTKAVLIFGESQNDRHALKELVEALVVSPPSLQIRREPLVLVKGRKPDEAQKASEKIARVVRADEVKYDVVAVIAHEDCDAVEPAHQAISAAIEDNLANVGVPQPIAATPASEMEAWWYLWPTAVSAVCSKWAPLGRAGNSVGLIVDAKKQLQRDLRPKSADVKAPEYEERHSIEIARQVKIQACVDTKNARSESFDLFAEKVRKFIS